MVELKIYLTTELNQRFRRIAMAVHGYGRGSLSKAAEEALAKWCQEQGQKTDETNRTQQGQAGQPAQSRVNPDERPSISETPTVATDNGSSKDKTSVGT